jgi:hypothetical protein
MLERSPRLSRCEGGNSRRTYESLFNVWLEHSLLWMPSAVVKRKGLDRLVRILMPTNCHPIYTGFPCLFWVVQSRLWHHRCLFGRRCVPQALRHDITFFGIEGCSSAQDTSAPDISALGKFKMSTLSSSEVIMGVMIFIFKDFSMNYVDKVRLVKSFTKIKRQRNFFYTVREKALI